MNGKERVVFGEHLTSSNPITSIKPKRCHEFELKFNSLKKKVEKKLLFSQNPGGIVIRTFIVAS